ncbi:UbiA family prenyltransferase [Tautonia sociabilis]|uniref:4-hydroxybenzoate polyprenyltransferase n=1 Tax=Tautonia sociabilis TaxID=2080755 RepID=A0A432MLV9_9BACT|nr:UbiA family prenyltransferase [Tautonia sociabilis]RUL88187.1 4-hydroxybenzoate polyprenyltransferase [Tautonia sociabilis]
MRLKPYLQLVRLPNVFTAAADSLSGFLIVGGALADVGRWLPLAVASMAIYAAGIALNDVFDLELDRIERPGRPLPSGRVSVRFAKVLSAVLLGAGLASASVSGMTPAVVALVLVVSVVSYDAGIRRSVLGPELMGACRGLNVLLGMSLAPGFGGPAAWAVAVGIAVFIVGVTWISRFETEVGRRAAPAAGIVLQGLGVGMLAGAGLAGRADPGLHPQGGILPALPGLIVLLLAAGRVARESGRAVWDPRPETLQRAVKAGVLSLIWLHVGVVACVRGPVEAMAVAVLWLPSAIAARWIDST